MKILVITKLFPTEFNNIHGIFNKEYVDYFSNNYPQYSINVIRSIPVPSNVKLYFKPGIKILIHPKKKTYGNYTVYYPLLLSFGKYLLQYHHILYFKTVKNSIRKNQIKFDIIHSYWLYPDGYISVKLAKLFNKKVIVHLLGGDANILLFDTRLSEYNEYTLTHCDQIIVCSYALKARVLEKFPVLENKISVIHNSVEVVKFSNYKLAFTDTRLSLYKDAVNKFLFVGRIEKEKGIWELLEAVKLLRTERDDFKIFLVGSVNNDTLYQVDRFINQNNLESQVIIIGKVKDVKPWYHLSDVFLLPSHSEGLPMVILEALASGIPVIATNVGGVPEVINNETRGELIPVMDPSALSKVMLKFCDRQESREKIIQDVNEIDIKYQAEKVINIYKKLLI